MLTTQKTIDEVVSRFDNPQEVINSFLERKYVVRVLLDAASVLVEHQKKPTDVKVEKELVKHLVQIVLFFNEFTKELKSKIPLGEAGFSYDDIGAVDSVVHLKDYFRSLLLLTGPLYAIDPCPTSELISKFYNLFECYKERNLNLLKMIEDLKFKTMFLLEGKNIEPAIMSILEKKK